jgi:chlorophyllide reductase subunit Y
MNKPANIKPGKATEVRYDDAADVPMLNDGQPEGGMGCSAPAPPRRARALRRMGAMRARTQCALLPRRRASPNCWSSSPRTIPPARTTSRNPCARHSAPCGWGLRMRRTATVLSGSACCVYGLTFTSHFYGAKRTVGYVPFNSETLVTGKLFEDIRDAVHRAGRPGEIRHRHRDQPVRADGLRRAARLLPKEINGVRIVGIDVPGFGVPTHAEAKDVLAGAMLKYAREEIEQGPVTAPSQARDAGKPTVTLVGEMFPVDPVTIGNLLEPMGLAAGPVVPTREWRELYSALDCAAVAAIHPFYTASFREFEAAGRPITGSAPVGIDGTASWLEAIGKIANVSDKQIEAAKQAALPAVTGALSGKPIKGRITVSGYEGSELLVARLLIEAGAEVPYVGTACAKSRFSEPTASGLPPRVCTSSSAPRWSRTSLPCMTHSARPRHRHHAAGAGRQAARHSGPLLHQPHFRAPADGRCRCRLAGAGGQRGHRQQGPFR